LKGQVGFTTFHAANWHPLTWLSHMLDVELFGTSAGWHHRMNWLLHLLNTELLFLVLWRMTGGYGQAPSWRHCSGTPAARGVGGVGGGAQGCLSTLFWILTMGVYIRYVERRRGAISSRCGEFCPGLMCKPMLVTLPFVLLLLDWWPLGRMAPSDPPHFLSGRLSVPVVSGWCGEGSAAGVVRIILHDHVSGPSQGWSSYTIRTYPFGSRISNAFVSYVVYLGKTVCLHPLRCSIPIRIISFGIPIWQVTGAVLLLGD